MRHGPGLCPTPHRGTGPLLGLTRLIGTHIRSRHLRRNNSTRPSLAGLGHRRTGSGRSRAARIRPARLPAAHRRRSIRNRSTGISGRRCVATLDRRLPGVAPHLRMPPRLRTRILTGNRRRSPLHRSTRNRLRPRHSTGGGRRLLHTGQRRGLLHPAPTALDLLRTLGMRPPSATCLRLGRLGRFNGARRGPATAPNPADNEHLGRFPDRGHSRPGTRLGQISSLRDHQLGEPLSLDDRPGAEPG